MFYYISLAPVSKFQFSLLGETISKRKRRHLQQLGVWERQKMKPPLSGSHQFWLSPDFQLEELASFLKL